MRCCIIREINDDFSFTTEDAEVLIFSDADDADDTDFKAALCL